MGIGKDFDPSLPVTPDNTPSPWKGNPEKAREDARKGGLAKANRSELTKSLEKLRKQQLKVYERSLEKRVVKFHKLLTIFEKELLTPVQAMVRLPDGTYEPVFTLDTNGNRVPVMERMTEGKLELCLKYQKQLHEQVIGKPNQRMEVTGNLPITLVINEEPEPIDVTCQEVETVIPDNLLISEEAEVTSEGHISEEPIENGNGLTE